MLFQVFPQELGKMNQKITTDLSEMDKECREFTILEIIHENKHRKITNYQVEYFDGIKHSL